MEGLFRRTVRGLVGERHILTCHAYNGSMDTILYFYLDKKDISLPQPCTMERIRQERYILLRIGLNHTWIEKTQVPKALEFLAEETADAGNSEAETPGGFFRRRKARKREKEHAREREIRRKQLWSRLSEVGELIYPMLDYPDESYCVYEEALKKTDFHKLWQQYCSFPEFHDYMQDTWAEPLLRYAEHSSYLVLGNAFCLPGFLWRKAERMKSLQWILPGKQYTEELAAFEEDICQEFGLAIDMHVLKSPEEYRRVRLKSKLPVNIIDFSGEERLQTADLPSESIWLDMSSMEEKRRRIEDRKNPMRYFSLKKQWKQPQKGRYHLDTISKNGYNT